MTDLLKQLDAAAELKRLIPRPNNGMIAQLEQMDRRQEYNKAASEIDHAAVAAELRAKDAEIERLTTALAKISVKAHGFGVGSDNQRLHGISDILESLAPAAGATLVDAEPLGNCRNCGRPFYTTEGFCGGCKHA